ncbi:type II toxin-antitoxin system RelE/ParE family toxin [Caballeronia humi]|uniref:Addiction module antitoxin n=1 Tax=Caballeronia humi TaxID=326474 RepID=A0A158JFM6_9BURK|nr:type II toxin-antitoxin system RelE/ParE family toxin [Caballeronia humi]SAL67666.1 addiction module antitoxin [Caballeronia humi]
MTPLPIIWTDEAREIFLEYLFFISEKDQVAAERLFDRVENSLVPVAYFPYSGRPGRVPSTYEIVAHPNYVVIYEVREKCIEVVDFTHVKKLYPPGSA